MAPHAHPSLYLDINFAASQQRSFGKLVRDGGASNYAPRGQDPVRSGQGGDTKNVSGILEEEGREYSMDSGGWNRVADSGGM